MSEEGVQQGDPLGPLLFCLVIQPIVETVKSEVNQWYLDDGSIGGPLKSVIEDVQKIIKLPWHAENDVSFKNNSMLAFQGIFEYFRFNDEGIG